MTYCAANECDYNYMRYVGYTESNTCIQALFSKENIEYISKTVTNLTRDVDCSGRPIVVPNKIICSVLDDLYQGYRPSVGDIYTRYSIPTDCPIDMVNEITNQAIEVIVNDISVNIGMEQQNAQLNIWNATLLGDFNEKGLRQHAPIKTLEKTTNGRGMVSFMTY